MPLVSSADQRQAGRREDLVRQPAPIDAQPGLCREPGTERPSVAQPRRRRARPTATSRATTEARRRRTRSIRSPRWDSGRRVIRHPHSVWSAWLSKPVSSRCALAALITTSCRTATSRTVTLRVKTTLANGSASSPGRFERRAPFLKIAVEVQHLPVAIPGHGRLARGPCAERRRERDGRQVVVRARRAASNLSPSRVAVDDRRPCSRGSQSAKSVRR